MIKAIVFDFDGTILDTESHEYTVLRKIFQDHGTDLPLEVWVTHVGTQGFDPYAYLEELIGRPLDKARLRQERAKQIEWRIKQEKPRPGVVSLLKAARDRGLAVGLASSSNRAWVTGYLEHLGLLGFFDCICTSDDVAVVKPDPALYNLAAQRLNVKPGQALAVEDSRNGALAAKRAGLFCVVVPNAITAGSDFGDVDLCLESLADIDLNGLLEQIGN